MSNHQLVICRKSFKMTLYLGANLRLPFIYAYKTMDKPYCH
jgi:hypothetical protein